MTEGQTPSGDRLERLERRLERERLRRREAESVAESGTRRLYELNRDLDDLVERRTEEATTAARVAEAALASRAELLRLIAHEVLTPIHQISGMLELIDLSGLAPVDRDRIASAGEAAVDMARLFNDVADLVASETNRLDVAPVPCRPTDHLKALTQHWRTFAARRGILLVLESDLLEDLEIVTDPARVRRVMDELMITAAKSARSRVVVRTRTELAENGQRLVIEVHDDGPGDLDELWTLNDLLSGGTSTAVPVSTVVGQLLAQRMVAALGGESGLGRSDLGGTVRSVVLPVVQPDSR